MHTPSTGLSHRSTGTATSKEFVGVKIYISQWTVSCSDYSIAGWAPIFLVDFGHDRGKIFLDMQTSGGSRFATLSHCWGKLSMAKLLDEPLIQFTQETL